MPYLSEWLLFTTRTCKKWLLAYYYSQPLGLSNIGLGLYLQAWMGDRCSMTISADSPLDETLNRCPLALLLLKVTFIFIIRWTLWHMMLCMPWCCCHITRNRLFTQVVCTINIQDMFQITNRFLSNSNIFSKLMHQMKLISA